MPHTELLDLVNEKDEVVGTTTKEESHKKRLAHRIAVVLVFRDDSVLVNTRHDSKLLDHSVGGHVHKGESYKAAAAREAHEEIGLSITPEELNLVETVLVSTQQYPNMVHWFGIFSIEAPESFEPSPQEGEVDALHFEPISEVEHDMRTRPQRYDAGFLVSLNAYLKQTRTQHDDITFSS